MQSKTTHHSITEAYKGIKESSGLPTADAVTRDLVKLGVSRFAISTSYSELSFPEPDEDCFVSVRYEDLEDANNNKGLSKYFQSRDSSPSDKGMTITVQNPNNDPAQKREAERAEKAKAARLARRGF